MAGLKSTVSVPYRDLDEIAGATFVLEPSPREQEGESGYAFFRVHPSSTGINLRATSGTIRRRDSNLTKHVCRYLTFSGTDEVPLGYPDPGPVQIEGIGRFVNEEGEFVQVTFTPDYVRRRIVASEIGYGVIKVTYNCKYDLWKAEFDKTGNTAPFSRDISKTVFSGASVFVAVGLDGGNPDDDSDPDTTGYLPLMVVGVKGDEVHTLSLSPAPDPTTDQSYYVGLSRTGGQIPKLKLEIDPQYPPRLSSVGNTISASCRVRVYPALAGVRLERSSGNVRDLGLQSTIRITESISFNGNASTSLGYQPIQPLLVDVTSVTEDFFDKWGNDFNPFFARPTQTITAVEWLTGNTYSSPVSREVGPDEIVVTDSSHRAIPAYGAAQASYTTSYRSWEVTFSYNSTERRFSKVYLVASYDDQVATLMVDPPPTRGMV